MTTSLTDRLRAALPAAMKLRDTAAVTALRSALAAVENAAAVPVAGPVSGLPTVGLASTEAPRRDLDEAQVADIVTAEVAERLTAADEYDRLGRTDRAARLRAEAEALVVHLDGR